jgi:hypothetical protein
MNVNYNIIKMSDKVQTPPNIVYDSTTGFSAPDKCRAPVKVRVTKNIKPSKIRHLRF